MTSNEFVTSTLEKICNSRGKSASNSDFVNFSKVLDDFLPIAHSFVECLSESPSTQHCNLLTNLIDYWVKCAAEKFQKSAVGLPSAEIQFQRSINENKENVFIPEWMEKYQAVEIQDDITLLKFGRLGQYLCNNLFMLWSHSATKDKRRSISYPKDYLVGRYSRPVVYYAAR